MTHKFKDERQQPIYIEMDKEFTPLRQIIYPDPNTKVIAYVHDIWLREDKEFQCLFDGVNFCTKMEAKSGVIPLNMVKGWKYL